MSVLYGVARGVPLPGDRLPAEKLCHDTHYDRRDAERCRTSLNTSVVALRNGVVLYTYRPGAVLERERDRRRRAN